jgi:hypothetical protein
MYILALIGSSKLISPAIPEIWLALMALPAH